MNWKEEQAQFWAWINRPQDLSEKADSIAALMAPHSHIGQAQAVSIYNNAFHQRLIDVSSALFPVLYNTLGAALYTQLWLGYMAAYPPRNGPIHLVGEHLHTYLQAHPQFGALPAAADIVQLESHLTYLFDKADEPAYTLAALQALPQEDWSGMHWHPKQDWALFQSQFDLEKYWRQMQAFIANEGEPGNTTFSIEALTPAPSEAPNYLVLRKDQRMQFQLIRPEFATFLMAIQRREDFAHICVTLAQAYPEHDIPALSLSLLLRAIELELLCQSDNEVPPEALS
ncbi:MAG: HvfC/BufC family peptide modification chaperone [Gammaproteobacteria bacterium]